MGFVQINLVFATILMKRDFVSRVERVQMDPSSHLHTCINEKTASFKVVTDVVPATTSSIPKSK